MHIRLNKLVFFFCFLLLGIYNPIKAQSLILPNFSYTDSLGEKRAYFFYDEKEALPVLPMKIRQDSHLKDLLFYWIFALFFLLGMVRTLYGKYVENFIKVIFNSTLRQSQLVEQMNQTLRPTFYLNLLFIFSFSTYLCLIISYFLSKEPDLTLFLTCTLFVFLSSIVKSVFMKLLGWVTGFERVVKHYLSVFWMMNKAIGLICLFFSILLAFSPAVFLPFWVYLSFLCLLFTLLFRYLKIWGNVRFDIYLKSGQLALYILCIELTPILLIIKCFVYFFMKMQ